MDELKLENLPFFGIVGILQETWKLIHQWRKIFTQITLAFILPLSLLFFTNMEISNFFLHKISHDKMILQHTQKFTPQFLKLSDLVSSERIYVVLFTLASLIFSTIFSLLSTSAVVYTVACIYTARDVSFDTMIRVLPKVWRKLLVTFLCVFAAFLAFNFVAFGVMFLIPVIAIIIYGPNDHHFLAGIGTIFFFFTIFYLAAIWYLTIIWQLSSVVSVLEASCGFKAMAKSKGLLKGKMKMVVKLTMLLNLPLGVAQLVFYYLVVRSASVGVAGRGILGICWVVLFMVLFLVNLVVETMVYFVCKSFHCESVDKVALSEHLQGYLLDHYVQLKVVDDYVQLAKLQAV